MKPIGGFFEIEIPESNNIYHKNALALTTGRACLHLIIKRIKPKKIYIPYYTCDALFKPMLLNNIKFEFYSINKDLEPKNIYKLKEKEYFIYINYFGIKRKAVKKLIGIYGHRLIVDNSHDFFSFGYKGLWSFNSARKYFGVPDGAYLYSPQKIKDKFKRSTEISVSHLINRLIGKQDVAYRQFVEYEKSLNAEIKAISIISEKLLSNVDYEKVKNIRKQNFNFFKNILEDYNCLEIKDDKSLNPFCYPLLLKSHLNKKNFHKNKFFIPSLWLDTINRNINGFEIEKYLSKNLLPLPIDHRYTKKDLRPLVTFIIKLLKNSK